MRHGPGELGPGEDIISALLQQYFDFIHPLDLCLGSRRTFTIFSVL